MSQIFVFPGVLYVLRNNFLLPRTVPIETNKVLCYILQWYVFLRTMEGSRIVSLVFFLMTRQGISTQNTSLPKWLCFPGNLSLRVIHTEPPSSHHLQFRFSYLGKILWLGFSQWIVIFCNSPINLSSLIVGRIPSSGNDTTLRNC